MNTMLSSSNSIRFAKNNQSFYKNFDGKSINGYFLLPDVKQSGRIAKKNAGLNENAKPAWNIV